MIYYKVDGEEERRGDERRGEERRGEAGRTNSNVYIIIYKHAISTIIEVMDEMVPIQSRY